jgi:glycosyltransferase involved in cell wall biosynthesis
MIRLAFVIQRYGLEVNGGAETHCRQLAERLRSHMQVEVLTTCAVDHLTWRNVYPPGLQEVNGIPVYRFPVDRERDIQEFNRFTEQVMRGPHTYFDEMHWMELQGPISSGLLQFLDLCQSRYDLFFFFTYLYATTFLGLQVVPHKSVLLATAHDDPWIRLKIFRPLFHLPRAFVYNSPEERSLIHRLFGNQYIPGQVLGHGIDVRRLAKIAVDPPLEIFHSEPRVQPDDEYIVYVGRVDPSKGCDQLFDYFIRYKAETLSKVKLVVIGRPTMAIPEYPDIISLGFLPEEPFAWMARARALVLPSVMESLSLVVLESMALGVPVLVNGRCAVTRGHCRRSNGGLYYYTYEEFASALTLLLTHSELRRQLGRQGQAYVKKHYAWDVVEGRFVNWLTWVAQRVKSKGDELQLGTQEVRG